MEVIFKIALGINVGGCDKAGALVSMFYGFHGFHGFSHAYAMLSTFPLAFLGCRRGETRAFFVFRQAGPFFVFLR